MIKVKTIHEILIGSILSKNSSRLALVVFCHCQKSLSVESPSLEFLGHGLAVGPGGRLVNLLVPIGQPLEMLSELLRVIPSEGGYQAPSAGANDPYFLVPHSDEGLVFETGHHYSVLVGLKESDFLNFLLTDELF
jgi:hypothetical protein